MRIELRTLRRCINLFNLSHSQMTLNSFQKQQRNISVTFLSWLLLAKRRAMSSLFSERFRISQALSSWCFCLLMQRAWLTSTSISIRWIFKITPTIIKRKKLKWIYQLNKRNSYQSAKWLKSNLFKLSTEWERKTENKEKLKPMRNHLCKRLILKPWMREMTMIQEKIHTIDKTNRK